MNISFLTLATAFRNVLVDYDWKSYTIVYESKENLIRLKQILEIHDTKSHPISVRRLNDDYLGLLKEIKERGDVNIVLDISSTKIVAFLQAAKDVNMLSDYNNYFITNLDTHTLDYSSIGEITTNITCLRLVKPSGDEMANALRFWRQKNPHLTELSEKQVSHEAGLVNDAMRVFGAALIRYMIQEGEPDNFNANKYDCKNPEVIGEPTFGKQFFHFLTQQDFEGATGKVVFNKGKEELNRGKRTEFSLEILEYNKGDFNVIGQWDPIDGVNYGREVQDPEQQIIEKIQDKKFKVIVKKGDPFLFIKPEVDGVVYEGNARYEGYTCDLIAKIAHELKFHYELELVNDGNYGSRDAKTGKWNGIVKMLMDRKGDLGIADLTITYEVKFIFHQDY